jgi:hypothetical protein
MQLIYLSPVPWTSFAQRPQKFARWFHEVTGGNVLWVEPYPSRFPELSDLKKRAVSDRTEQDHAESWLTVLAPGALPLEPLPGSGLINGAMIWGKSLKALKNFSEQADTLLVIGKPTVMAIKVLDMIPNVKSMYDAMDDFPSFYSGWSKKAMTYREIEIVKKTKHMIVSSTVLMKKWEKYRADLSVVPNALDAHLLPPMKTTTSREDRHILGYVGTIGAWFDWDWVITLAKTRPQDTIRLIGPLYNPSQSSLPSNIELLPACSHEKAMNAMLTFDIALIPFLRNSLTASVDPIKYYEFKALGLPIVSTNFGEMVYRTNERGVYISKDTTSTNINKNIEKALNYKADPREIDKFRTKNSWKNRFSKLSFIL